MVCRRFGLSTFRFVDVLVCRRFGLSTFWFVDVSVGRRFSLSTFRFVDVSVCRRFGCRRFGLSTFWLVTVWVFGLSTFRFVDVLVCRRFGLSTFWFVDVSVGRRFSLSTFRFVDVSVCRRFGCRRFGLSTFWLVTVWGISYEIALRWLSLDLTYVKSILVPVVAWARHASGHCLSQCWLRSLSPYGVGVTGAQWVKPVRPNKIMPRRRLKLWKRNRLCLGTTMKSEVSNVTEGRQNDDGCSTEVTP